MRASFNQNCETLLSTHDPRVLIKEEKKFELTLFQCSFQRYMIIEAVSYFSLFEKYADYKATL